jgi:predicted ABC-type ATPase
LEVNQSYLRGRRLRVFAGPNGSGKSTVFEKINSKYDVGFYLNSDNLEKELKKQNPINLSDFHINNVDVEYFNSFISHHSLTQKAKESGYLINLEISNNTLLTKSSETNSYEASIAVDFIRNFLLYNGKKLSFETVMSHHSKIDILNQANSNGYKTYLYFVSTESVDINIGRVKQRVLLGGHDVPEDRIRKRYYNSLNLLKLAVKSSYRSFIFDNSKKEIELILEVESGSIVTYHKDFIPEWVNKYLIKKSV